MDYQEKKQKQQEFAVLRGFKGMSLEAISKELSISKTTAVNWERDQRGLIEKIREVEVMFMLDAHKLGVRGRTERLAGLNKMLKEELEKRDLSDLKTLDLIKLYNENMNSIELMEHNQRTSSTNYNDVLDLGIPDLD